MDENQQTFNRPLLLWWHDIESKKDIPAGVAFFEAKYGEYRLKIDIHPDTLYFLRPISSESDSVLYRVEVAIKRDEQIYQKRIVGEGFSSPRTNGDVYLELGPYSKTLIMEMYND